MEQQKISTPSVVEIADTKILTTDGYSLPKPVIAQRATWSAVIDSLADRALSPPGATPTSVMDAMNYANSPSLANPFITASYQALKLSCRGLVLIGPIGSFADFEGTTDEIFATAISSMPPEGGVIGVLAGTYIFNSTVDLPRNVVLAGIHPFAVIISGSSTLFGSLFSLAGEHSRVELLTLESLFSQVPLVELAANHASVVGCRFQNYNDAGVGLIGDKSYVRSSYFDSSGTGVRFQGLFQTVESCMFSGTMAMGALVFENSHGSAIGNTIADDVEFSYSIPSPSCSNNKLIANHLGIPAAVSASEDYGTASVRYANTPDTFKANENNFLTILKNYTGQPALDTDDMTLSIPEFQNDPIYSSNFAIDPNEDKDAASILSAFDLSLRKLYQERNWHLVSSDPVLSSDFETLGTPVSGIFSWDGTTLVWPDFYVKDVVSGTLGIGKTWSIPSGSIAIPLGSALVVCMNPPQALSGGEWKDNGDVTALFVDGSLAVVSVKQAVKSNYLTIACRPSSSLIWLQGFKTFPALGNGGPYYFDVDGQPLPIATFVGVTDPRNTLPMPDSFAMGAHFNDKASEQSALLRNLYERSNLRKFTLENASIDTTPIPGGWASFSNPEAPSHILQLKGSAFALFPNYGLYRWDRSGAGWLVVPSCPSVGPFASMSYMGTGLALLALDGSISYWKEDTGEWRLPLITPNILASPSPTDTVSYAFGQGDYSAQTPDYSLFSTCDGRSFSYSLESNHLKEVPRIYGETPRCKSFIGRHIKDTGYNVARDSAMAETGDNGSGSYLHGLPLGKLSATISLDPSVKLKTLGAVQWDNLSQESWSFDPESNAFLLVAFTGNSYYVIGGGLGQAKLHAAITIGTAPFDDFTAHGWLTDCANQEVTVFGTKTSTLAFTAIRGVPTAAGFIWTKSVLGDPAITQSQGAIGVLNRYDNRGNGDVHVLASDPFRANRPTWWSYSRASGSWSYVRLADIGGDVIVAGAVANSFSYVATGTTRMAGWGLCYPGSSASIDSVCFLVRDVGRASRPTAFFYTESSYSSVRLSESAGMDAQAVGADGNATVQFIGGFYQKAWNSLTFVSHGSTGPWPSAGATAQLRFITYFATSASWSVMVIGTGGTYFNNNISLPSFYRRTGSLVGINPLTSFADGLPIAKDVYVWTQTLGLVKGTLTGHQSTGFSPSASWAIYDKRQPALLPVFPSNLVSTAQALLGASRRDLSIQVYSNVDRSLPVLGATTCSTSAGLNGLAWFEPGTRVKNIANGIWLGINRTGYLWIGNSSIASYQQELASISSDRGDIVISGLGFPGAMTGSTADYSYATNGSGTLIAIVYRDALNGSPNNNRLTFILYNTVTNTIVHERLGYEITTALMPLLSNGSITTLASVPKIAYNSLDSSWSIVAQDDSRLGGQLVYYNRTVGGTWSGERVGLNGENAYAEMLAQMGRKPTLVIATDGSSIVASEASAGFNLLVSRRSPAGVWSKIYYSLDETSSGFKEPQIVRTTGRYWVFGDTKVALSPMNWTGVGAWSLFAPSSPSLADVSWLRAASTAVPMPLSSSVIVAVSAGADGAIPAGNEILVWCFKDEGTVALTGAFTAKGRLQSLIYSGEEENTVSDLSWTSNQRLLYSARRSTSATHWSLRGSADWTKPQGESLLGSGRCITLGEKLFREQWFSEVAANIIHEYGIQGYVASRSSLPIAQRTGDSDLLGLKWSVAGMTGYLFTTGIADDDTTLQQGTLAAASGRRWPVILGCTRLDGRQAGPAIFYQGSLLGLYPSPGLTNAAYFGVASIASSNLFKLNARPALTFRGTHRWWISPTKYATLIGPFTIANIDTPALGTHVILDFPLGSFTAVPAQVVNYWSETNQEADQTVVAVAEIVDQGIVLNPLQGGDRTLLIHGHLEPKELLSSLIPIEDWCYAIPYVKRYDTTPKYIVMTGYGSTSFALGDIESLKGIQPLSFTQGVARSLVVRRTLPNNGWFLSQEAYAAASTKTTEVLAVQSDITVF